MNTIEFHDDVDPMNRWPCTVSALWRVDYACGPSELSQLRLLPCRRRGDVRVEERALNSLRRMPSTIAWTDLPGATLGQRSLRVIAVHCFGSVDLPARVKGQAGWSSVGISLLIEGADAARDLHVEVSNVQGSAVSWRWRLGRGDWTAHRPVAMHRFDTDPLRALLRLAFQVPPAREARHASIEVPLRRSAARCDALRSGAPITGRDAAEPRTPARRIAGVRAADAIV